MEPLSTTKALLDPLCLFPILTINQNVVCQKESKHNSEKENRFLVLITIPLPPLSSLASHMWRGHGGAAGADPGKVVGVRGGGWGLGVRVGGEGRAAVNRNYEGRFSA